MNKSTGAIMLVAGTCIGSGMIALPMVLVKIAIIPSIFLMLLMWLFVYFTSLITIELNLKNKFGEPLGQLAAKFSGKFAALIGSSSFIILSFALVAVYIYAGSSVIEKIIATDQHLSQIATCYSIIAGLVFLLPIRFIDYINRFLFLSLLAVIGILIAGLFYKINWANLPLYSQSSYAINAWQLIVPVVFTSFGFQGTCHVLVNYCNLEKSTLKTALFWGSLIPMLVYILWNTSSLAVIYEQNPEFYQQMINGKIEVGDLVKQLSHVTSSNSVQFLAWWISILSIITSLLGVGVSLCDSLTLIVTKNFPKQNFSKLIGAFLTIFPAYLIAIIVPNAFISVLGFAGMILTIIAIILPIYLYFKANIQRPNFAILKSKIFLLLSFFIGIVIIIFELLNIYN